MAIFLVSTNFSLFFFFVPAEVFGFKSLTKCIWYYKQMKIEKTGHYESNE